MNYIYPQYSKWNNRFVLHGMSLFFYVYNYQILNYNAHWRALNKLALFFIFFYSTRTIYHYKKDILRANLFDEYVQLRADEIIKEREPLLKTESNYSYLKLRGQEMGLVWFRRQRGLIQMPQTILSQLIGRF